MNPTTKAAVIEALESCDPGDWSTGHVIHPSYNEDKVNAALALLYAEPEPTPEDDAYPFYELKFIMRVLGHEGSAPRQDWQTAYGMAQAIFMKWHGEKLAAVAEPTPEPGERGQFEAWCRVGDPASIQPQLERDEMGYTNRVIAACWEAWQAARASKGTR